MGEGHKEELVKKKMNLLIAHSSDTIIRFKNSIETKHLGIVLGNFSPHPIEMGRTLRADYFTLVLP